MEQEKLQIFIQSVIEYFEKLTGSSIEAGVPFLKEEGKSVLLSYTGGLALKSP